MPANPVVPASEKVQVPANAGFMDSLQSAGRLILFLSGVVTAILAFVKTRDIAGLASYLQSNAGQIIAAISGLAGFTAAAYGVFKSHKRGSQLETAAADPRNKAVEFK